MLPDNICCQLQTSIKLNCLKCHFVIQLIIPVF
uniref:Uncharacterized protein n=1 Tax=Anguilla anguilla TaxID=7936 RepID=A0A0E9TEK7_ANGAN